MENIVNVNDTDFDEVIKSKMLVLVDFWAEWCSPCRIVAPILKEIAEEYQYQIVVAKCDVDNTTIGGKYGIRNIPTILFFKEGNVVDKQVGAAPKSTFINKINVLL
jgi:thioredoxin 1